jgi:hypothetical protein
MPINREFRCAYVTMWVQVKRKWDLTIDATEQAAINGVIAGCRR